MRAVFCRTSYTVPYILTVQTGPGAYGCVQRFVLDAGCFEPCSVISSWYSFLGTHGGVVGQ